MNTVQQRDDLNRILHKRNTEIEQQRKRIQELEYYITREGEMNGICTFDILNKICNGCRCGRREKK